ncbi:MAG: hypothetical protein OEV64_15165 [Desulfobulbaceae bacterium]|nr:hypothetical protein [Desulfobulbaceae bacterium]
MEDVQQPAESSNFILSIWHSIIEFIDGTNIPEQVEKVDVALFTNPWFAIPFFGLIAYQLYKQAFRDLTIEALIVAIWYVSGTTYMKTLIVGGELQVNKVLPVLFCGAAAVGFIIYLLFGRSD